MPLSPIGPALDRDHAGRLLVLKLIFKQSHVKHVNVYSDDQNNADKNVDLGLRAASNRHPDAHLCTGYWLAHAVCDLGEFKAATPATACFKSLKIIGRP